MFYERFSNDTDLGIYGTKLLLVVQQVNQKHEVHSGATLENYLNENLFSNLKK